MAEHEFIVRATRELSASDFHGLKHTGPFIRMVRNKILLSCVSLTGAQVSQAVREWLSENGRGLFYINVDDGGYHAVYIEDDATATHFMLYWSGRMTSNQELNIPEPLPTKKSPLPPSPPPPSTSSDERKQMWDRIKEAHYKRTLEERKKKVRLSRGSSTWDDDFSLKRDK